MKIASTFETFLGLVLVLLVSCSSHKERKNIDAGQLVKIDVLGDAAHESFELIQTSSQTKVLLHNPKLVDTVCIIPNGTNGFNQVYLEANATATDEKGLRIVIRNTDQIPDCMFIDLRFDRVWKIEGLLIANTNQSMEVFICAEKVDLPLKNFLFRDHVLDQMYLLDEYFGGRWGCDA